MTHVHDGGTPQAAQPGRGSADSGSVERAEHLARVLQTMDEAGFGFWEWDVRADAVTWSQGVLRIFGVERDSFGQSYTAYLSYVHPEDRPGLEASVHAALAEGAPYRVRHRVIRPDGSVRWVRCFAKPTLGEGGEMLYLSGTTEDVTAMEERAATERSLQERLVHAQKLEALGQLAGGVAHDFNNLLTAIMGNIDLLRANAARDGEFTREAVEDTLEQIHQASDRASHLTRQLLTFGRRPRMRAAESVNLNEVVGSVQSMLQRIIGSHIRLELDADATPAWVRIDVAQLEQIVLNLAINARDAMPEGGLLVVGTHVADIGADDPTLEPGAKQGRYAVLRVLDTGTGMPPEVLARAFEPFFTTKGVGEGTGLGLATVYGTVRSAGGHIHVRSDVGTGTLFEVRLPLSEPQDAVPPPPLEGARGGSERVLVVEDQPQVRAVTCALLRKAGYSVLEAADGLEALRVLEREENKVDLVVTDVVMPHLDGRSLARRVRERAPGIPFVFVSGYIPEELDDDLGAVLPKPFKAEELLRTARHALDQSSSGPA